MTPRGIPLALSARMRKSFVLFWAALFVLSLTLQYATVAAPASVLAAAGDPNVATYDQCSNDDGDGYTIGDLGCRWINGNLQHINSTYFEGDATVQRLWLSNLFPGSEHSITLKYGTTKGGKHAYDYLTTWNYSENWITDADLCDGITNCTSWGADDLFPIPDDPNPAFAAETPAVVQPAGRFFTMRNGDMTAATIPTVVSGSYAGDSETAITITFTVGSDPDACETNGATTCSVALWFGAHVALTSEWASGGAATVSGSPYHVALGAVDGRAIGQRDNQMQSDTIVVTPTLSITKTADAASVNAGAPIGFTVTVTNNGPTDAVNVTLADALPAGSGVDWSIAGTTGTPTCSITGTPPSETLNCSKATLAAGASFSVHITSPTTSASCGTYPNTATAQADNAPVVEATASTTVNCGTIVLEKTTSTPTVNAGDPISYTLTVSNPSQVFSATGVTVSDNLPAGSGIDWSISGPANGFVLSGTPPSESLSLGPITLGPGESRTVTVTSGTSFASCGVLSNSASASSSNDGQPTVGPVTITINCPALTLTKTAGAQNVSAGDPISFTVTLANAGPGAATGVAISDSLPAGTGIDWSIVTPVSGWSLSGAVGSEVLAFSATSFGVGSTSVTVTSATSSASCATYSNTASASATNHASLEATASTTVNCPDITVLKTGNGTIDAGDTAVFTITVTNLGPGTATNVTLTDLLPTGVAWEEDSEFCSIEDGTLSCNFGDLGEEAHRTVHVSGVTDNADCGTLPNTAVVAATNEPSANTENNSSSATITVNCGDITIAKVADASQVNAGGTIGFTVTVTNNGSGTAKGVTVSDTLPTGPDVSWSIDTANSDAGWTIENGVLKFGPVDLDPKGGEGDSSTSVHITSRTTLSSCKSYPNSASVTTTNDGSGQAQASITVICPPPPPPPQFGNLTITKVLNPATGFPGGTFNFTVSCAQGQSITLAAGQATGSVTINNLPAGASCTVTEVTPLTSPGTNFVWVGTPQYAPGQTVTIPLNATATVTVTNFRGAVAGATATPRITLPPTDTIDGETSSSPGVNLGLILLMLAGITAVLGVLAPVPARIRRRDRRG